MASSTTLLRPLILLFALSAGCTSLQIGDSPDRIIQYPHDQPCPEIRENTYPENRNERTHTELHSSQEDVRAVFVDDVSVKTSSSGENHSTARDDYFINSFLQHQLDVLSSDQQCWLQPGVTGLRVMLQGNISQPPASVNHFVLGRRNITSSGNVFSIIFTSDTFSVNNISETTFLILSLVHRLEANIEFEQIIGLITVSLTVVDMILYFVEQWMSARVPADSRILQIVHYGDVALCQIILLISGFALSNGIDDLAVMSLCDTSVLSMSWVFSLGTILVFIWNGAMAAMTVQWFLGRRSKKSDGSETPFLETTKSVKSVSTVPLRGEIEVSN
ncbi:hypothetical protein ACHAQJ_001664 [Trichoderma viride]